MIDSIIVALGAFGIMSFPFDVFCANVDYCRYESFRAVLGYELRFYHYRAWRSIFYAFADLALIIIASIFVNS